MRRAGRICAAVVSIAGASVAVGAAQRAQTPDDVFRDGMEARGARTPRWSEVVARMSEAIAIDPAESSRRIGGGLLWGGSRYLPHFFLGEAHFNLGDCPAAMQAWEESAAQRVIDQFADERQALEAGMAACEGQGYLRSSTLAAELQRADDAIERASERGTTLSAAWGSTSLLTPEIRSRWEAAREDVTNARESRTAAEQSRRAADVREAIAAADRALEGFRQTDAALAERAGGVDRALRAVDAIIAGAVPMLAEIETLRSQAGVRVALPSAVDARRQQAEALLARARNAIDAARRSHAAPAVDEARRLAEEATAALGDVHREVERRVETAVTERLRTLERNAADAFGAIDARRAAAAARLQGPALPMEVAAEASAELAALETEVDRLRNRFEQAVKTRSVTGAQSAIGRPLAQVNERLDAIAAILGSAGRLVVPEPLWRAAASYLEGDYAGALAVLPAADAAAIEMPVFRVHAHLFRAAALFALARHSGQADDPQLAEARREAGLCHQLIGCQPDPRVFSPAFRAFLAGLEPAVR